MTQTITPIPYTLTLNDIRDYLATLDEPDKVAVPGHYYRCLGVATLRWKYGFAEEQVRVPGMNMYFEVVTAVPFPSIGTYPVSLDVTNLLAAFDNIAYHDDRFDFDEHADTWPCLTKAELRAYPDFAVLFAPAVSTATLPSPGWTPCSTQPIQQANLPQWILAPQVAQVVPQDGMEPVRDVETRSDDERIREQLLCLPADITFSAESVARMCGYTEDEHKEGLVRQRMKTLIDASRSANGTTEHFVVVPGSRGQEMRWE